jgi:hypothetical protein
LDCPGNPAFPVWEGWIRVRKHFAEVSAGIALGDMGLAGRRPNVARSGSRLKRALTRFEVAPTDDEHGSHELLVFVDDVEMTSRGAGMGMDPASVLIPQNLLVATNDPHQVPIAHCSCGEYGSGMTDVIIARDVRDVRVVLWEWIHEAPMSHPVTFDAERYDAEVERIGADRSWQRPTGHSSSS